MIIMSKWCKWYCFLNTTEEDKRKTCNKPNCRNKTRAELLKNFKKKEEAYQRLTEIEKELY